MNSLQKNISLKIYNTFGIDVQAKYYVEVTSIEKLRNLIEKYDLADDNTLIIGEGSNILFTKDYNGFVIRPLLKGIKIIKESDEYTWVEVGAGENWDEFVEFAVSKGLGGVENLSFIPGSVGACPIQNIGAYGVEVKSAIESVKTVRKTDCKIVEFSNEECHFNYRSSIFKTTYKDDFIVCSVVFKLLKKPVYYLNYGKLLEELKHFEIINLSAIRQAIIKIRKSNLPDPEQIGNAGSFFKNPVVSCEIVEKLNEKYDSVPTYKVSDSHYKVAAGWLIEKSGWKGKVIGRSGVHSKQSLVLTNLGGATGKEIYDLSEQVKLSVKEKFNIELEREVNIV